MDDPLFMDASALVKRYIPEQGTRWVRSVIHHRNVAIAEITLLEVAAAFARRARMGDLDAETYADLLEAFLQDAEEHWVISTARDTIGLAIDLTRRHPLRAYDALQLATALRLANALAEEGLSLTFVSADAQLCSAAAQEGLATINPNQLDQSTGGLHEP